MGPHPAPVCLAPRFADGSALRALAVLVCALTWPGVAFALDLEEIDLARRHADQASELFTRCNRFVHGWLAHADPDSGLIPQNLSSPQWTPENSAADNYPFMVLSAYFTDQELMRGRLTDMLHAEIRLTTRVGALPDAFSFGTQGFVRPAVEHDRLIFGASEYCKDGLLPMTELLGRTEWFSRLRAIAGDICEHSRTETQFGLLPSTSAEVNGEMMQVLSRLYPATGDPRLLAAALRLGDAYFLEVLPHNRYLPCHAWDFAAHRATSPVLRLNDHGSEIIGGLSEVYALASRYAPDKAAAYAPAMRKLMDTLLAKCLNEEGLWFQSFDTATGVGSGGVPDTWGYIFDPVYTYGMLTGDDRYHEAVERAMKAICSHTNWGGADAYADSIESGIVLLNRIDIPETWQWVDQMTAKMSAIQKEDGVIEGWHGDGNVARTWLMVALARTAGCHAHPWRPDLRVGAVMREGSVLVSVRADEAWSGRLCFDYPRHREHFGVSPNYPRLNEYAEWFTVEDGSRYLVRPVEQEGKPAEPVVTGDGGALRRGLPLEVPAGGEWLAEVELVSAPPHGVSQLRITGPDWAAARGDTKVVLVVKNLAHTPTDVQLTSTWGAIAPEAMHLGPRGAAAVALRGAVAGDAEAIVCARPGPGHTATHHRVLLVADVNLTDYLDLSGGGTYADETYWWLNDGDLSLRLKAEPGRAHVLSLYWGSKNDDRTAELTLAGEAQTLTHGGYDGFRWYDIEVPAEKVTDSPLEITFTRPDTGKAAFLGRLKLRTK